MRKGEETVCTEPHLPVGNNNTQTSSLKGKPDFVGSLNISGKRTSSVGTAQASVGACSYREPGWGKPSGTG